MSRDGVIGFDRRVELGWLDAAAGHVAAGQDARATRQKLFDSLEGVIAGGRKHGSACDKTINVLSKTWSTVPEELVTLRDRGLELLPSLSPAERVALHWGILLATYRFFGDVAEGTGRLLALQGSLTLAQLTRRMRENWGDRSTLSRATQRVIRSMVEWGALGDTDVRGEYSQASARMPVGGDLGLLLVEGLLHHLGEGVPVDQVIGHHALFPFDLGLPVQDLRRSGRLRIHRQGLDQDVVGLVGPGSRPAG